MSESVHKFGEQSAADVVTQASTFVEHIEDARIWPSLHDPIRGRMQPTDVARGRTLLAAARTAVTTSAHHKGDAAAPMHALDDAEAAASQWLEDQLAHARGLLHETRNDAALDALSKALTQSEARDAVARKIRAVVALVQRDDTTGAALSACYPNTRARNAILLDGEHLAAALESLVGAPNTALGPRHDAVVAKDASVDTLARWLYRWSLVAHRVVSAAGQVTLGIAHTRHHPAHRPQHPAAPPPAATTPPTS